MFPVLMDMVTLFAESIHMNKMPLMEISGKGG